MFKKEEKVEYRSTKGYTHSNAVDAVEESFKTELRKLVGDSLHHSWETIFWEKRNEIKALFEDAVTDYARARIEDSR